METEVSRRTILAGAALALVSTAVTGCATTAAQAQTPERSMAIKTRKASCTCGQLTVTCTGPDPERISLCTCFLCQTQTGSAFSVQATFPKEQVKMEGKSTAFKFPIEGAPPVPYRNCSRTGTTLHFCPTCGSSVYYVLAETPDNIGVKVGCFADPTFPPPMIAGFEEYKHPWALNVAALPMPGGHHQ